MCAYHVGRRPVQDIEVVVVHDARAVQDLLGPLWQRSNGACRDSGARGVAVVQRSHGILVPLGLLRSLHPLQIVVRNMNWILLTARDTRLTARDTLLHGL